MKILDRYLGQAIIHYTFLVLLVLISLHTFISFVTELDDVGHGSYEISHAIKYILYSIPQNIYDLLPVAVLLGSVLGLGNMASQSELIAMRAAGFSIERIIQSALSTGMIFVVMTALIGEIIAPPAERAADKLRSLTKVSVSSEQSREGFWTRTGDTFNRIGQVLASGEYRDIEIFEFDPQHKLRNITQAVRATYHNDGWHLKEVTQRRIFPKRVIINHVPEAIWKSRLNPEILQVVMVDPHEFSVWGLHHYIKYLRENKQATERHQQAFWSKIIAPFNALIMMFLAIPFVFGPLRSVSMGQRVLVGALVGIGFFLFNRLFNQAGLVFGFPLFLSAAFPSFLSLGIGMIMMRRVY
ncbi:LPS export ABC transporter permease LptG [Candidatus Nitrosacidococcus tergens]|uniref:Permease YjgP/YjgQ family protein n=1 Tax=Candidatus Nitrosacidococcus tergens TaxID=553981 RepID=A0A7G1Q908_9GAMM|nr:LPS export ABC transporter permease LptG [Candidatus Nitrosacidococcus tergens]CAB1275585.1 Permease YjgP/YjgQ family protein [Candidatus Nitrosacidococcus tergens]